jgi:nucleotide-binding universal stress UspA family protein
MKFKPSTKDGGVLVELSPEETQLPADLMGEKSFTAFQLKKILVPVDFSNCSKKALMYAIPFAQWFDATITLVHVTPYFVQPPGIIVEDTQLIEECRKGLNDLVLEISGRVKARAVFRLGNPASKIVEVAQQSNADLIIISTQGNTGLMHVFLGSTAERVVRHAPCPVLVVREKEHEFISGDVASFNPTV